MLKDKDSVGRVWTQNVEGPNDTKKFAGHAKESFFYSNHMSWQFGVEGQTNKMTPVGNC